MSMRSNFVWGFVVSTVLMVAGCIFAIWLVFRIAGPN
jgi:hypothetical protein